MTSTPSTGQVLELALEVVGDPHHLVGVGAGAGEDDRGAAVLAEGRAGLGRDDVGDAGLGLEDRGDLVEHVAPATLGDGAVGAVHDDLDRRAGVAAEALGGQLAHGDRLRAVGLPAGAGEVGLDLGGEDAEADDEEHPDGRGEAAVVGDPDAEAAEGAGAVAEPSVSEELLREGSGSGGQRGGEWPSTSWQGVLSCGVGDRSDECGQCGGGGVGGDDEHEDGEGGREPAGVDARGEAGAGDGGQGGRDGEGRPRASSPGWRRRRRAPRGPRRW